MCGTIIIKANYVLLETNTFIIKFASEEFPLFGTQRFLSNVPLSPPNLNETALGWNNRVLSCSRFCYSGVQRTTHCSFQWPSTRFSYVLIRSREGQSNTAPTGQNIPPFLQVPPPGFGVCIARKTAFVYTRGGLITWAAIVCLTMPY